MFIATYPAGPSWEEPSWARQASIQERRISCRSAGYSKLVIAERKADVYQY